MIKSNPGIRKTDVINRRMYIIGAAKIVVFVGIIARLFSLQINEKERVVYTSGLGGLFKPGITVGKMNISSNGIVNFFSDFTQLSYVKIVSFKPGGEQ